MALRSDVRTAVFILSTGRTGTMALAEHLDAAYDDEVTAVHEPKPVRHFRLLSNRVASGRPVPVGVASGLLRASRWWRFRSVRTPVYVESNWYLYGLVDALVAEFGPRARILHVVRDPRTIVPSFLNYGTFVSGKGLATRWLPYWYLRPEQCVDNPLGRAWAELSPPERVAWHWRVVNGHIDRSLAASDVDRMVVRYEDLMSPGSKTMTRFLNWIGLKPTAEMARRVADRRVNASESRGVTWSWKGLDEATRTSILCSCGPQMHHYGYDPAAAEPLRCAG